MVCGSSTRLRIEWALVEITADEDYTVPKLIRDIPSESSNTSGMTYGDGALWLAANGPGERWRPVRDTDAKPRDRRGF